MKFAQIAKRVVLLVAVNILLMALFASHPPLEERIARLEQGAV
jgi:Zn-dependent protease with chaperone function